MRKRCRLVARRQGQSVAPVSYTHLDVYKRQSRYNDAVGQINRNKRIFESNGLETWRKTNENWLGGEDMCFKKDAYIDAFSNYLVANNLSPSVLQNNANATSTYEAAQNYAMEKAFEATFQEANKVATFLSQIEHSSKIGEVLIGALMPFKKTPLNILKPVSYTHLDVYKRQGYSPLSGCTTE